MPQFLPNDAVLQIRGNMYLNHGSRFGFWLHMVNWSEIQNLTPPWWKHCFSLLKTLSQRNPPKRAICSDFTNETSSKRVQMAKYQFFLGHIMRTGPFTPLERQQWSTVAVSNVKSALRMCPNLRKSRKWPKFALGDLWTGSYIQEVGKCATTRPLNQFRILCPSIRPIEPLLLG